MTTHTQDIANTPPMFVKKHAGEVCILRSRSSLFSVEIRSMLLYVEVLYSYYPFDTLRLVIIFPPTRLRLSNNALFISSAFVSVSPDQGHDRPCRRDVGRVFLAGVRPDSPSRRRIPSCYRPGPGGGVESARCSLGTHPPCEGSICQRFKRRHVRRFGVCAEADDTVVESWCVRSAPGV